MTKPVEFGRPRADGPIRWNFDAAPAAVAGLFLIFAWRELQPRLINGVTYAAQEIGAAPIGASALIPLTVAAALLLLGAPSRHGPSAGPGWTRRRAWVGLASAGATCALSTLVLLGAASAFLLASALAVCAGWTVTCYAVRLSRPRWWTWVDRFAPLTLAVLLLSSTIWHAAEQFNLWQHFSLGYADFGFFVTELEYCLPWKDVPHRFADTRMGYHSIPMFYLLAPLYALLRSPVFLMVVGPLALNLAAVPFYQLARHRGASASVALLIGAAWLALPSLSRLPYANTYGFQSIYLAVPWLAFAWSFALRDRWTASHFCLAAAMLCEETVCGVAFGWGLYLACFTLRRRDGLIIAAVALAYLAVCTLLIIPAFAAAPTYSRMHLFGEAGASTIAERLLRPRVGLYLVALFAPLALGLFRTRQALALLVVPAPTLLLIILMQNQDYLNIKYWHQSSALPALYLAAVIGVGPHQPSDPRNCGLRIADCGLERSGPPAPGLLVAVLLFHQLLGFSPLAQAYRPYVAGAAMQAPDPRMEVVAWVRSQFRPEATTVLATERMAAHFCDYRAISPAAAFRDGIPQVDLVVLDRDDTWDPLVREGKLKQLIESATGRDMMPVLESGPTIVLRAPGR